MVKNVTVCQLCNSQNERVFSIPLYSVEGDLETYVYRCKNCKSYMRAFDYTFPNINKHFLLSTYTNLENEKRLKNEKEGYFKFIVDQCFGLIGENRVSNVLDIGSCFGHLLDIFSNYNVKTYGVEPFDILCEEVLSRGRHLVFKTIDELPLELKFDIVTIMDTLYLIEDPAKILIGVRQHITNDGLLVLRIVNRVWIFKILQLLGLPVTSSIYGDHKYSFSLRGMQELLNRAGFNIVSIVKREPGKLISNPKKRLLAKLLTGLSTLPYVTLSPGLIYFCKPDAL